jgi:DNA-binding FadR family transcriptional regulator
MAEVDLLPDTIKRYLLSLQSARSSGEEVKLPPLDELARELGVSRGKLREDLLAAQAYGLVEMRPGDGTYVRPMDFYTAIRPLVLHSIASGSELFDRYYRLRAELEVAFWDEAARALQEEDMRRLEQVLEQAEQKLKGKSVEIPHREHRELHVILFGKLDNPYVRGILEAYWDAYEAVGLHRYFDLTYYERVWASHRQIVEAVRAGEWELSKTILRQHFTFLEDRMARSKAS